MNITKLVQAFEEHQEKKLNSIQLAAHTAIVNMGKAAQSKDPEEMKAGFTKVVDDLVYIRDVLAKNDFNIREELDKLG